MEDKKICLLKIYYTDGDIQAIKVRADLEELIKINREIESAMTDSLVLSIQSYGSELYVINGKFIKQAIFCKE